MIRLAFRPYKAIRPRAVTFFGARHSPDFRRCCLAQAAPAAEGDTAIPTDTTTLIALGVGAVIVVWLIFSVVKKVFGFLFLGALAFGLFMVWQNPELRESVFGMLLSFWASR